MKSPQCADRRAHTSLVAGFRASVADVLDQRAMEQGVSWGTTAMASRNSPA